MGLPLLSAASSVLSGLGPGGLGSSGGDPGGTSSAMSGGTFTSGSMGGKDNTTWLLVIGLVIVLAVALSGHGRRHE